MIYGFRPYGIQHDVAADCQKMAVFLNQDRLEPASVFEDRLLFVADRKLFLNTLFQVTQHFHWVCRAYCLMNNHYHLLVETPEGNLSKGMRQLNGVYTQAFNRRHTRVGQLFQGPRELT
jgi:REP element-mobilizing transposase RayT